MPLARQRVPMQLDDPSLSPEEFHTAVAGLARLDQMCGGDDGIFRCLAGYQKLAPERTLRVLDLATGFSTAPIAWARRAQRLGVPMQITSLDVCPRAIDAILDSARQAGIEIGCIERDCLKESLPSGFDVIVCSMFLHCLDDRHTTLLLQAMQSAATMGIVVCDCERSLANLALTIAACRIVSRSRVVHHDAPARIRSAYTRSEFMGLAQDALERPLRCHRILPCQFIARTIENAIVVPAVAFA